MIPTKKEMKSIWFFVGIMLSALGTIIFLTGLYYWFVSKQHPTVLAYLHPDIWWGGIMAIVGAVFLYCSGRVRK